MRLVSGMDVLWRGAGSSQVGSDPRCAVVLEGLSSAEQQLIEAAEQFDAAAGAAKTLQFKLARAASGRTPRIDSSAEAFVAGHTAGMRAVREALGLGE